MQFLERDQNENHDCVPRAVYRRPRALSRPFLGSNCEIRMKLMVSVLQPFLDVLPYFKECHIKFSVKTMSHDIAKFALRLTLGGLQRN